MKCKNCANYKEKKGKGNRLSAVWKVRLKLWSEGNKLRSEGKKLWADGDKLMDGGSRLRAEGILEEFGNISLDWKNYNHDKDDNECHLENGEVYKP